MNSMNINPIVEINTFANILFVCMSFEDVRWRAFLEQNQDNYKVVVLIYNKEFINFYKEYIEKYQESSKFKFIETSVSHPLETSDKYLELITKYENDNIDVDCSTFTHEHLLILFKVFSYLNYSHKLNIIYTRPNEYLVGKSNGWLSKGVKEIRNVLGYSGNFLPSKQLHLIILVGLENERIEKIIEEYEPAKITIGRCTQNSSTSNAISDNNKEYHSSINNFSNKIIANFEAKEEFEFSCDTPENTYEILNGVVHDNDQFNNIIIAANSKISTLGVAKLALMNENIQVCYAQPLEYNIESYTNGVKDFKYYEVEFKNLL